MDVLTLEPGRGQEFWLAFDKPTSEQEARQTFQEKFGGAPERIWQSLGNVLAGPVPLRKIVLQT